MGKEVTFDYSKAAGFVSAEEMEKPQRTRFLLKQEQEMTSWDGLIFRLIMTKKNLPESKRLQPKFSRIPMCCW